MQRHLLLGAVAVVLAGCNDDPAASPPSSTTTVTVPVTTTTAASLGGATPVVADVAYATVSDAQRLDLYVPTGAGPHPLVVFIHGGGWFTGDKRNEYAAGVVPLLVDEGYAVASVNYRLSGEATFPAQLFDVKAAIRWLRANAAEHGVDVDRIAAVGESAGAHLAALLGTTTGVNTFDDPALGNAGVSSDVQAAIDWYGPVDLLASPTQLDANPVCVAAGRVPGTLDPAIEDLLGAPAASVPDLATAANPISYLDAGREPPPFLIEHGDADCTVPHQASIELDAAITRVAGDDASTLVIVPGSGHFTDFDAASQVPTVLAFLAEHLR